MNRKYTAGLAMNSGRIINMAQLMKLMNDIRVQTTEKQRAKNFFAVVFLLHNFKLIHCWTSCQHFFSRERRLHADRQLYRNTKSLKQAEELGSASKFLIFGGRVASEFAGKLSKYCETKPQHSTIVTCFSKSTILCTYLASFTSNMRRQLLEVTISGFCFMWGSGLSADKFGELDLRSSQWRTWTRAADRKSTRLNSSHSGESRMPSSA